MQVAWEGALWFDVSTRTYQYDPVGVAESQRFSPDIDGGTYMENIAIGVWAGVMCQNCSEYEQIPNADMVTRFEFREPEGRR